MRRKVFVQSRGADKSWYRKRYSEALNKFFSTGGPDMSKTEQGITEVVIDELSEMEPKSKRRW